MNLSDQAATQQAIQAKVNQLYGEAFITPAPRALSAIPSAIPSVPAGKQPADTIAQTPAQQKPAAPAKPAESALKPAAANPPAATPSKEPVVNIEVEGNVGTDENLRVDWRVRILSPKYKLNGPYSILVFLGPVPERSSEWRNSEELVGSVEVFANSNAGHCENCRNNADLVYEGVVYLNHVLARSTLPSFEPHIVAPFLKENLHWRVVQVRDYCPWLFTCEY